MIKGNMLDTFTVYMVDGDRFSFVAKDAMHARLMAVELYPNRPILRIEKIDQWEDN